ncbi:MAG: class I SAM-dependent methyltransferase [Bacteroidetes bacterium]|nr:class I SAM-dependent methyltransferase [Bacteroidota bacterium]
MKILLPGLEKQLLFLKKNLDLAGLNILVIGAAGEEIAKQLSLESGKITEMIVEDYDSLINAKLVCSKSDNVNIRIMDFEITDFEDSAFDLVYAQASISDFRRNKIVKEIKRILKSESYFCLGEVVKLSENPPVFVEEIFESSNLDPISSEKLTKYYSGRKFEILAEDDFSDTFKDFYSINLKKLASSKKELSDEEKSYYKKLLNRISHESNAFLKLGADKFIGFKSLIMKTGIKEGK